MIFCQACSFRLKDKLVHVLTIKVVIKGKCPSDGLLHELDLIPRYNLNCQYMYKLKSIFIAAVNTRWAVFFDEHWKNQMTLF
jgi:hypothetical protein